MNKLCQTLPFLPLGLLWVGLSLAGDRVANAAEPRAGEPRDVVFRALHDGTEQRYVEILPEGFDPLVSHSVLIALHGHGSDRWQFVRDARAECRAAREAATKRRMIYISPDYRAKTSWMGPAAEADTVQIIRELREKYRVQRVVVCGGSMGGTAALTFAALHPELVDGVVSMNGTANLVEYDKFQDAIAASYGGSKTDRPDEYRRRSAEFHADRLVMPIAVTTGGRDSVVPAASVLRLIESLKKQNRPVNSIHRPEGGHDTNLADATTAFDYVLERVIPAELGNQQGGWRRVGPSIAGRRWDIPFAAVGDQGPLLVLGGRTSWGDYKKPRPFDVLRWNSTMAVWENEFPVGSDWGPRVGDCSAPAWKDEYFRFEDVAGNPRPNWTVYGTFSLGRKFDYDPDTKRFYFYAGGKTFSYDPQRRVWEDLKPVSDPESQLGGILLWSSLCYDPGQRVFVLFGGGNLQTDRADPGTWTYSPRDNRWEQLPVEIQPPPRANSRLAYDPVSRKIMLFGGDQLNRLLADTWTLDVAARRWQQHSPKVSPAPRAGHALVWLPHMKRVALLGGYGYSSTTGYCESLYEPLPFEAWLWSESQGEWEFVERWRKDLAPRSPANGCLNLTVQQVDSGDRVSALDGEGLWQYNFDAERTVDGRWAKLAGVPVGTTATRTGSYDPQWYSADVPPADAAQVARELSQLTPNRWTVRSTPKRPGMNMDWGSVVFAPELNRLIRFSGGHSAYSGTAPQVYDVTTDRYSLPFAPELPIEYVYSNDQVQGEWSFSGNPWMTGHTYKSTGYDFKLQSLVFAPHDYTYFFDPLQGRWSRSPDKNPYRADFYNVTLCATPHGCVAWGDRRSGGGAGLWLLDAATRTWKPLPLKGELPAKSPDQHGLAFDEKRQRLLFFSNADKRRGDVVEYSWAQGEARWLSPPNRELGAVPSREAVYVAHIDSVLLGARRIDSMPTNPSDSDSLETTATWILFDCNANTWKTVTLSGDDPIDLANWNEVRRPRATRLPFHNSVGFAYDAQRKLVWAVGQYSRVHVLRLE